MWKVALGGRGRRRDQHRTIRDPHRRPGGHSMWNSDRRHSIRLLGQDDPVVVVLGGDQLVAVISSHPVTVGWKAGTQCSEDEEQEAGQQPVG